MIQRGSYYEQSRLSLGKHPTFKPQAIDVQVNFGQMSAGDSEKVVLSAIIESNELIYQCANLKAEDFTLDAHRRIFAAVWDLMLEGLPVEYVTLAQKLEERKELEGLGGIGYLTSLDEAWATGRQTIEPHVNRLVDLSLRRRFVRTLMDGIKQAHDASELTADCLSVLHERLLSIAGETRTNPSLRLSEYSWEVYEAIRRIAKRAESVIGLPTGISELDLKTTGLRDAEYYVIGAWAGEGKTAFAEQIIAENVSKGVPCLFFSQEMTKEQVLLRMIPGCSGGQVYARHLRNPKDMNILQMAEFDRTQGIIDNWPLWVNDASTFEVSQLVAHAHMMIHRQKIRLVVVDYLQLLRAPGEKKYEQISNASAALRQLAKSERLPVLAISQLSRPEGRVKRRPTMFDLKESGQIEQDANAVFLLHRPIDKKKSTFTGKDWIIIGKQREGPVGGVGVEFNQKTLTFRSRTVESQEEGYENDELF